MVKKIVILAENATNKKKAIFRRKSPKSWSGLVTISWKFINKIVENLWQLKKNFGQIIDKKHNKIDKKNNRKKLFKIVEKRAWQSSWKLLFPPKKFIKKKLFLSCAWRIMKKSFEWAWARTVSILAIRISRKPFWNIIFKTMSNTKA